MCGCYGRDIPWSVLRGALDLTDLRKAPNPEPKWDIGPKQAHWVARALADDGRGRVGFLFGRQHREARRLGSHSGVMDEGPLPSLGDRFGVQSMLGGELLGGAFDRCSAARTACVVVAQPCRTWSIQPSGMAQP